MPVPGKNFTYVIFFIPAIYSLVVSIVETKPKIQTGEVTFSQGSQLLRGPTSAS